MCANRVASHADQRDLQALDGGEERENFLGLAAGGKREDDIAANDHSQIAVEGLDRMQVKGGGSGGTQGGGDFAGDETALAHAGDDDASGTAEHEVNGALEGWGHGARDAVCQGTQSFSLDADYAFSCDLHWNEGC